MKFEVSLLVLEFDGTAYVSVGQGKRTNHESKIEAEHS